MAQFDVLIARNIRQYVMVSVEAESDAAAEALALKSAKSDDFDPNRWEDGDVFPGEQDEEVIDVEQMSAR